MRAERGPVRHTTFLHARRECDPGRAAQVWHLGIYKDKKSLLPIEYYNKLPKKVTVHTVFVLDPMPISGATAVAAMDILKAWGESLRAQAGRQLTIKFVCLVASESVRHRHHRALAAATPPIAPTPKPVRRSRLRPSSSSPKRTPTSRSTSVSSTDRLTIRAHRCRPSCRGWVREATRAHALGTPASHDTRAPLLVPGPSPSRRHRRQALWNGRERCGASGRAARRRWDGRGVMHRT